MLPTPTRAKGFRDQMVNMPTVTACRAAMAIINTLQNLDPAEQAIALASTFRLFCEETGLEMQDVMTVSGNIMNHASGRRVEFDAVAAYMNGELNG